MSQNSTYPSKLYMPCTITWNRKCFVKEQKKKKKGLNKNKTQSLDVEKLQRLSGRKLTGRQTEWNI